MWQILTNEIWTLVQVVAEPMLTHAYCHNKLSYFCSIGAGNKPEVLMLQPQQHKTQTKPYVFTGNNVHYVEQLNVPVYFATHLSSVYDGMLMNDDFYNDDHNDVIKWSIFRVTGPLCGELTSHRWITRKKASGAELRCFLWSVPE